MKKITNLSNYQLSRFFAVVMTLLLAYALPAGLAQASMAVYVGPELTRNGHPLLAGYGDEPSGHWLELVPAQDYPPGSTMTVGATEAASIPGKRTQIPQAPRTARYIATFYSSYAGFPGPLVNGGLNEHGVAARDVWSPSRKELVEMTPTPQSGPHYSDLSRMVMERATSAREAVELVGEWMEAYGYTTYGGNSHLFADAKEAWVLINFAGGQGLWVAERLRPDEIRVSRPGYIGDIPADFNQRPDDYRGAPHLIDFAIQQGWYDPKSGKPFNVHAVYGGTEVEKAPAVHWITDRLNQRSGEITLRDVMDILRSPVITSDTAGYGQAVELRDDLPHPELATLWAAPTSPVTAPFVPYAIGAQDIPAEFGRHRYLGADEASGYQTRDFQAREATEFAFRLFKRLMYISCEHPEKFLPEVQEALYAFETKLQTAWKDAAEPTAAALYAVGNATLARNYLSFTSSTFSRDALQLGNALLGSIEARTRLLFGIREPKGNVMSHPRPRRVTCSDDFLITGWDAAEGAP